MILMWKNMYIYIIYIYLKYRIRIKVGRAKNPHRPPNLAQTPHNLAPWDLTPWLFVAIQDTSLWSLLCIPHPPCTKGSTGWLVGRYFFQELQALWIRESVEGNFGDTNGPHWLFGRTLVEKFGEKSLSEPVFWPVKQSNESIATIK